MSIFSSFNRNRRIWLRLTEALVNIIIAGGSGFIGGKLIEKLTRDRNNVVLLTRRPDLVKKNFSQVQIQYWDAKTDSELDGVLGGRDAIINLTGESIAAGRWTSSRKRRIFASRIESTRALISAIEKIKNKPRVLINASAVGYYGNVPEGEITETSPKGQGFLADVCEQWEAEALKAQEFGVRVVLLRTGVVLDKGGGAMRRVVVPYKFFIGGIVGPGTQWFPWIHIDDEISAIMYALETASVSGPLNLASPESVQMKEFCRRLGKILHRPSWLPVPSIVMKIALGEMADSLLLQSQRVVPKKLIESGFIFQFPKLQDALENLLKK